MSVFYLWWIEMLWKYCYFTLFLVKISVYIYKRYIRHIFTGDIFVTYSQAIYSSHIHKRYIRHIFTSDIFVTYLQAIYSSHITLCRIKILIKFLKCTNKKYCSIPFLHITHKTNNIFWYFDKFYGVWMHDMPYDNHI